LLQTGSKVLAAFIQDPAFSRDAYNYWSFSSLFIPHPTYTQKASPCID
jgi:hypothetical protein